MRVTVTVCDVCEDAERETRSWQIRNVSGGVAGNVDLCEEHEAPLAALLEKASATNAGKSKPKSRATGAAPAKARYRPHGIRVTTPEEIEKKKREQGA
ncbi:hypothetical protein V1227_18990 [Lentzea sp. DG1S-22]|uniref:hypothetical protein n=1 Tax=Lentzea sp. DG1S-22 TaxID=3108822 RepID=UPI002E77E608|nr:hypothetical protein [Lentzea sp. DG1S-22]WVH84734.1 hypothetical protein V1227_18990 [Lentzea sp. DG1S-22]